MDTRHNAAARLRASGEGFMGRDSRGRQPGDAAGLMYVML
jgi:hypothetical protein